jgi:hypothetical protein
MSTKKLNSVAWVRKPLIGEASANFLRLKGAMWSARRIPTAVLLTFSTESATFSSKYLHSCTHEAEWTPFQNHYFSENLEALGIEPGPLDL